MERTQLPPAEQPLYSVIPLSDSLKGLVTINQELALFNFGNVVVRRNLANVLGVRIICGAPSGFEPAFTGYVGQGMLTAAIQGDSVAPTSKLILRTIRELSSNHFGGVLIIVPGDSGCLLNFGLAVERAYNDNLLVKLLVVNDDVKSGVKQGLTGIVLVNKIAGALSETDLSLTDVYMYCLKVTENMTSYFVSTQSLVLSDCGCNTIYTSDRSSIKKCKFASINDISKELIEYAVEDFNLQRIPDPNASQQSVNMGNISEPIILAVLLNNAGGLSKAGELLLVHGIITQLQPFDVKIARFYVGSYMSFPQRKGVSLTLLKLFEKELICHLDAPCNAPAWINFIQTSHITPPKQISGNLRRKDRLSPPIKGPELAVTATHVLELCVQFACDALISCERQLNIIDTERGDGDAGTRLKRTAEVVMKRVNCKKLITNHPYTFFESLSKVLENSIGGTAGCIYSILFEAAAKSFADYDQDVFVTPQLWLKALETAAEAIKKYGNVEFGDQTLYDPIAGCLEVVRNELDCDVFYMEAFGHGVSAAEEIAKNTRRNNGKYPDSGAHAVAIWMRAIYEGVKLRCV